MSEFQPDKLHEDQEESAHRRPKLKLGDPRPPMDATAIERIQKWPQCCRILENFMGTIVEPAWRDLENTDYVLKWRLQVHYSKDPVNYIKEKTSQSHRRV